ncbi:hypothetical protein Tco_0625160 [Tanacetum coccineum]|uniref:Uncharacterized protein n=1 Tax=Tanacetum coccineum TaxID=301880 RepID=A0ABQ4WG00_9ASTR
MVNLKFADTHNMVAFLSKPAESEGFEQIMDFLNENPIRYALMINPTIYTSCKVKIVNGEVQLQALVDGKKIIITESTVRRDLQLEDAEGVDCLPNATIFEQLALMGSKTTAWNEFSSTMAYAIIFLATNQKFNFSKYIFESIVKNLDNVGKCFMYPRNMRRVGKVFSGRETPLFPTMVVQNQAEMGEDEAVYKELDDSLVRATTTASSLEAKHDSGNINKTRSKATPNESSSLRTTSGGGPRGNTLQSGEDSLKLKELMELCTNLQIRVLDLEKIKTTQVEEIVSLKRRVKKLEQKKRSRTHRLKRLYKVGLIARVESSGDEEILGEDASKQGRINAIDADEDITLVNDQDDVDMFDVNTLSALAALKSVKPKVKANVVEEPSVPVSASSTKVSDATTTTTATIPTPRKGIVITELEEPMNKFSKKKDLIRLNGEIASKLQAEFDEEDRLAREKDEANVALTEEWDDIQAKKMFDRAFKRVNTFVDFRTDLVKGSSKRAGDELEQEVTKKQKVDDVQETVEVDDDQETTKIKELMKFFSYEEEVVIDAIPLATKPPSIVDWNIHKERKKNYYQIIRADGSSKMYLVFSYMLKSFDMEDFETLWKLVKAKYGSTRPVEDLDLIL